ncbi:MAG: hypothetical protein FD126_1351 [Elusimicrobia bacterium]|nr:MAG: hypothetical protein FD126_1351 [Elusimicrobiota bacterium]
MNQPPSRPGIPGYTKTKDQLELDAVKSLYADFTKAYEAKSVSQVLRYVSPDWEAGDGTSISDLQTSLSGTFSVFNELKCAITNVQASKSGQRYKVTYEMAITGRIFAQNIKHEEKSSVTEEVAFENGRPVIVRTVTGNFWYFE